MAAKETSCFQPTLVEQSQSRHRGDYAMNSQQNTLLIAQPQEASPIKALPGNDDKKQLSWEEQNCFFMHCQSVGQQL